MLNQAIHTIYDELIRYLAEEASPEYILAFEPSETAQARADYLVEQNKEGNLSDEERLELEQLQYFDGVIATLKAKAAQTVM